jgi:hypothetical protein
MESLCSFKVQVNIQQSTRRHIPKNLNLHQHHCEDFKSRMVQNPLKIYLAVSTDYISIDHYRTLQLLRDTESVFQWECTLYTLVVMEGPFTMIDTPPELAVTSFAKGRDCCTDWRVGISRRRLVLSSFHCFVTVNNRYSNRSKVSVRLLCILILLLAPCNWPGQNVRYVHHSAYSCHRLNPLQFFPVL